MTRSLEPVALPDNIRELLEIYPPDLRPLVEQSLSNLMLHARSLGLEVLRAEQEGLSYAEAVRRLGFMTMSQVHFGVVDLLQLELPNEQCTLVREMFQRAASMKLTAIDHTVFGLAASPGSAEESALARFALYQMLRLCVWMATWGVREGAELEASGALLEMDHEAEMTLRNRLAMPAMHDDDIRPLPILLTDMLEHLSTTLKNRRDLVYGEGRKFMNYFASLVRATEIARRADSGDAALLRNEISVALQRESLQLLPLVERHPLAFPSVDAAKQRRHRLNNKFLEGEVPAPRRRRLIDVIMEQMEEA